MAKANREINFYKNIFETGAKADEVICGIGYEEQEWLGLTLKLKKDIKIESTEIGDDFSVIKFGNYPQNEVQRIKHLLTTGFTKISELNCSYRFQPNDQVQIIKDQHINIFKKGDIVTISKIHKYPDETNVEQTYYSITGIKDNITKYAKKLDDGLILYEK